MFRKSRKEERKSKNEQHFFNYKLYKYEKRVFGDYRKKCGSRLETSGDYLHFCENYIRFNYQNATIFVYEEYLKSLCYSIHEYPNDILVLYKKGDEMLKFLIANKRRGNNRLIHEYVGLMRKTNVMKSPDYIFKLMEELQIGKPSFKVSASLLTSYTTAAIKHLNINYMLYAEDAFERMETNFKFVQIYLWNSMLNMYYKFGRSQEVWKLFTKMEKKNVDFTPFTYGSLMETCLHLDVNPRKGLLFHEKFKDAGFHPSEKHFKYVTELADKLRNLMDKQESSFNTSEWSEYEKEKEELTTEFQNVGNEIKEDLQEQMKKKFGSLTKKKNRWSFGKKNKKKKKNIFHPEVVVD